MSSYIYYFILKPVKTFIFQPKSPSTYSPTIEYQLLRAQIQARNYKKEVSIWVFGETGVVELVVLENGEMSIQEDSTSTFETLSIKIQNIHSDIDRYETNILF